MGETQGPGARGGQGIRDAVGPFDDTDGIRGQFIESEAKQAAGAFEAVGVDVDDVVAGVIAVEEGEGGAGDLVFVAAEGRDQ